MPFALRPHAKASAMPGDLHMGDGYLDQEGDGDNIYNLQADLPGNMPSMPSMRGQAPPRTSSHTPNDSFKAAASFRAVRRT